MFIYYFSCLGLDMYSVSSCPYHISEKSVGIHFRCWSNCETLSDFSSKANAGFMLETLWIASPAYTTQNNIMNDNVVYCRTGTVEV